MFEFFIALFGGVHYGGKILAERDLTRKRDKAIRNQILLHDLRLQQWESEVSDRALEEDLRYFIADPQNYEKVWEEVHAAYLQMPTYNSYTTILIHEPMVLRYYGKDAYTKKQRENIAEHERDCALSIMLARRGKVCSRGVQNGSVLDFFPRGEGQHSKKVWDETFEFWLYIRDELRRNNVNAQLIFKVGVCGEEHNQRAYYIDDVEKFRYLAGRLTWLPLTFYDENLKYMIV